MTGGGLAAVRFNLVRRDVLKRFPGVCPARYQRATASFRHLYS